MNKSEWPQETKKKKKSFENNSRIQLIFGFRGRWSLQHYERYIIHLIKKQVPVYSAYHTSNHVHYKIGSLSIQMLNIVGDGMIFTIINFDFCGQN